MSSNKRAVRFSEAADQPPQKKTRASGDPNNKPKSVLRPSKVDSRTNQDELDDVDDWNELEDGDNDANEFLPSQSQLIEAKRKRREQRSSSSVFEDTDNDRLGEAERSLATEGVKIEPFHMRDEETDGTGYFDGDTYVFRKNPNAEDGEADAWADTLMEDADQENAPVIRIATKIASRETRNKQGDLDGLSREDLYKRILPLLGGTRETIMQAISRFGRLANAKTKHRKKQADKVPKTDGENSSIAKSHLDHLTGAANALLLQGEVNIYDTTRNDILRRFPSLQSSASSKNDVEIAQPLASKAKWEYQGNEDGQLHMVTTEQMITWVKSGYFVGPQRVKIRTVVVQQASTHEEPSLSTKDDLLADLMDDDDDEEEERPSKKPKDRGSSTITVKGEWMWSDEVQYQKYL